MRGLGERIFLFLHFSLVSFQVTKLYISHMVATIFPLVLALLSPVHVHVLVLLANLGALRSWL